MSKRSKQILHKSVTQSHKVWRDTRTQAKLKAVDFAPQEAPETAVLPAPTVQNRQKQGISPSALWEKAKKWHVAAVGVAAGVGIGLYIGWIAAPVEWDASNWHGANMRNLPENQRALVIDATADLYSYELSQQRVTAMYENWDGAEFDICNVWNQTADPGERQRLNALAYIVTSGRGVCGE